MVTTTVRLDVRTLAAGYRRRCTRDRTPTPRRRPGPKQSAALWFGRTAGAARGLSSATDRHRRSWSGLHGRTGCIALNVQDDPAGC